VTAFTQLLARLARFSDGDMERPWNWPGHEAQQMEVRNVHWRCFELEQGALIAAPPPVSEAAAAVDLAQASWGDLRGLLSGLDDDVLDADPGGGSWTLRTVLTHVAIVEARYARQVDHAAHRSEDAPVYLNTDFELSGDEQAGGIAVWIDRLEAARAASDAVVVGLQPAQLERPSKWAGHDIDVRFRLHRFSAHLAEHTIHAEKVLRALGQPPSEARQAVRRISFWRGLHERRTPLERLAALDAEEAALAASIGSVG
jgi:uncharacterized damage-inducible protein DinB